MTALWWIRRDLRLHDQPALRAAIAAGPVVPVYVLDPALLERSAPSRRAFLFAALRSLDADLQRRGARLIVRTGPPADALTQLVGEAAAESVFCEEDYTPYARRRDARLAGALPLRQVAGQLVVDPASLVKADGKPYLVYGPYAREWKRRLPEQPSSLAAPGRIEMPGGITTQTIPDAVENADFAASEGDALRRLRDFAAQRISAYGRDRDRLDLGGTSALSPYFHFGLLSLRTAMEAALEAGSAARERGNEQGMHGAEVWLNELIWREFYVQILYHFPSASRTAFNRAFADIAWRNDSSEFAAWKNGQTGVPVVDAAMRQLRQTGWIHNRARMLVASYLVKDLLIDWRWGERWFMENLIDGDPSANNGGWQWTAGTGTDAAPYFRVFNPVLQSRRYDPDGTYIRRWVPELADIPTGAVHAPWEKGLMVRGYPARPLVDHATAVKRARLAYATARDKQRTQTTQ